MDLGKDPNIDHTIYGTIYILENVCENENGCTFISAAENVRMIYLENECLGMDVF